MRKNIYRILSLVIAMALALTMSVFADESGAIKITTSETVTTDAGETVKITLALENGVNVKNYAVSKFEYDENVLLGDANGDGVIRASDARLVLRFAAQLQKYTDKQKKICDIDGNGAVNASDARIVLKASASLI